MQIVKIERQKRRKDSFQIIPDTGEPFFSDALTMSNFDIYKGKELSVSEFNEFKSASELRSIKDYCLYLLTLKMYTVSDIRKKLYNRYDNRELSQKAIEDLLDLGILDDEKFTALYVQTLVRYNKYSIKEIRYKLMQKGLSKDLVELYTAADQLGDTYEQDVAVKLAQKKWKSLQNNKDVTQKKREKLFQFLARKGFSFDLVKKIVEFVVNGM